MPHSKQPNYLVASTWTGADKTNARTITIIDTYKEVFGSSIPFNRHYWTMCGAHFDINLNPVHGELNQLLDTSLIEKPQFCGVDREVTIIEKNKKLYPLIQWFHGDFYETMESAAIRGDFNPAIINYDGVMQPRYGAQYIIKIFKLLDRMFEGEVLLITNFVLANPYNGSEKVTYTIEETLDIIITSHKFPDHWSVLPFAYTYGGYSKLSNAQMGVLGFVKKRHEIRKMRYSSNREV